MGDYPTETEEVIDRLADDDRNPNIVEWWDRDDGTAFAVTLDSGDFPLPHEAYYVPPTTPLGPENWIRVRGRRADTRKRRLRAWGRLDADHDIVGKDVGSGQVPASVALDTRKTVVAYLWAVDGRNPAQIANVAGYARSTVQQYISDFLAGRTE